MLKLTFFLFAVNYELQKNLISCCKRRLFGKVNCKARNGTSWQKGVLQQLNHKGIFLEHHWAQLKFVKGFLFNIFLIHTKISHLTKSQMFQHKIIFLRKMFVWCAKITKCIIKNNRECVYVFIYLYSQISDLKSINLTGLKSRKKGKQI